MASGVTGKLLHIDLTTRQTRTEELPEAVMRKFLGGGALASYLLLRDMPPGVDPLGPDNVLVLATSVINGLSLSGTNRYTAAAKSPLTGGYGESEAGGWWGPELRAAGWDGLVIRGKAAAPPTASTRSDRRAESWPSKPPASCPPAISGTAPSSTPRPSAARPCATPSSSIAGPATPARWPASARSRSRSWG